MIPFYSNGALVWRFNIAGNYKTYICLHLRCPIFLPSFKHICMFSTDFKSPNIRFQGNPFRGNHEGTCGRTDMMKLIGAFHDCANAPKMKKRNFMRTRYQELPLGKTEGYFLPHGMFATNTTSVHCWMSWRTHTYKIQLRENRDLWYWNT